MSKKLNNILPISLLFFSGLLLMAFAAEVDCDDETFLDDCAGQIAGYKFLKANKVDISGSKSKVDLSSVFSNGSTYILTACGGSENMVVSLFDRNHRKIMTNYDKNTKRHYPSITYKCTATGVYYFQYEFVSGGEGCGVGIIGFKQK